MTIDCLRCGQRVPRLTVDQIHCTKCAVEVANIIAADTARRTPRFPFAKTLDRAPAL